jgi:mitochondrial fission protein ELM1
MAAAVKRIDLGTPRGFSFGGKILIQTRQMNIEEIRKSFKCSFHKRSKKWEARIHVNGKNIFLGYWDSQDEASDAYIAALAAAMPRPKKK